MLSSNFRVVVIGGGIIGCLSAWFLRRRGAEVVVVERREAGREASWAGAGILCPIHPWLYPDSLTHLVQISLSMYPSLCAELEAESGIASEWTRSGLLMPLFPGDKSRHRTQALAWSKRFGWTVEDLDAPSARQQEPALAADVQGALLWPEVAQVRNPRLLQAVRLAMLRAGVLLRERTEVVGLDRSNGQLNGVILANGQALEADAVLLAAGSWSGELMARFGMSLPVEPVKGQMLLLHGKPAHIRHIIKHDDAYLVPRQDGRILVGASLERVGFNRDISSSVTSSLLATAKRMFPSLAALPIERQWTGFRPGTPDGLPYLGPVPSVAGLWVASGHYRNGVVLAPVTAEIISRWMLGEAPDISLADFRPDRPVRKVEKIGLPE